MEHTERQYLKGKIITRDQLKTYFENLDVPSQEDFWEWMDSYWHKDDILPQGNGSVDLSSKANKDATELSANHITSWKNTLGIKDEPFQITISTASNISTLTKVNSLSQNGKNVLIDNAANNISLSCEAASESDFVATYVKLGSGSITFNSGSGTVKTGVDGTFTLNGNVGSRATIIRNANNFLIYIYNV